MAGVFLLCEHDRNDKAPLGARVEGWTKGRVGRGVEDDVRRDCS